MLTPMPGGAAAGSGSWFDDNIVPCFTKLEEHFRKLESMLREYGVQSVAWPDIKETATAIIRDDFRKRPSELIVMTNAEGAVDYVERKVNCLFAAGIVNEKVGPVLDSAQVRQYCSRLAMALGRRNVQSSSEDISQETGLRILTKLAAQPDSSCAVRNWEATSSRPRTMLRWKLCNASWSGC